jgi:hypothetical protein
MHTLALIFTIVLVANAATVDGVGNSTATVVDPYEAYFKLTNDEYIEPTLMSRLHLNDLKTICKLANFVVEL